MKKAYIIPELEVVCIQTQQMLAASVPELSDKAYEGGDILAPGMEAPESMLGLPSFVFQ